MLSGRSQTLCMRKTGSIEQEAPVSRFLAAARNDTHVITVSAQRDVIQIGEFEVEVVRKEIKHLHLAVYPPEGRVRVSAPRRLDDDAVRLAVVPRLGWIRRQRAKFAGQERQSQREMVTGESHYVQGQRYRLAMVEGRGASGGRVVNSGTLELRVRPEWNRERRERVLQEWYRELLRAQIPVFIAKWEPVMGVEVADWGIKRMKTRWGSCNITARRIWLNLELAKKPVTCLEYVVVHEMVHLLERRHNDRFRAHMDRFLPGWRLQRDELNRAPLGHEEWTY